MFNILEWWTLFISKTRIINIYGQLCRFIIIYIHVLISCLRSTCVDLDGVCNNFALNTETNDIVNWIKDIIIWLNTS